MGKRILIVGCGDIGTLVGATLCGEGYRITGLRRRLMPVDETGITYGYADLTRPETLADLQLDFDLLLIIVTPDTRSVSGYEATYLKGVGNLLQLLSSRNNPLPVIYVSSTRVYGQHQAEWVDEESETQPIDDFGRILLAAEQQVLAHNSSNIVVRFSGIYGRGKPSLLKIAIQRQPIQYMPSMYTNRVHIADCVGALTFLARQQLAGACLFSHYVVSDDEPAPKWQVIAWLARQLGHREPPQLIACSEVEQGKRCSNRLIRAAGYQFQYPSYREGYADLLACSQ